MQLDKLFSIEKRKLRVVFTGEKFVLPLELQGKVDTYWNDLIKDGGNFFRGEVFTISDTKDNKDEIVINVDLSDYAHYLYTRRIGLPEDTACKNLHTSCLIETSDGMIILGKMGKQTSVPGNIQCVGGGLDNEDIHADLVDLEHSIKKELMEEVGIDANNEKLVADFVIRYLRYDSNVYSIAAIFILKLKITSREFRNYYDAFEAKIVEGGALPEFGELVYLPKNKVAVNDFYNKEKEHLDHYVMPLLDEVTS